MYYSQKYVAQFVFKIINGAKKKRVEGVVCGIRYKTMNF